MVLIGCTRLVYLEQVKREFRRAPVLFNVSPLGKMSGWFTSLFARCTVETR